MDDFATKQAWERWEKESVEWNKIKDELIASGKTPSAWDVTDEQRQRMKARGEKLVSEDADACKALGIPFRLHVVEKEEG